MFAGDAIGPIGVPRLKGLCPGRGSTGLGGSVTADFVCGRLSTRWKDCFFRPISRCSFGGEFAFTVNRKVRMVAWC